MKDSNVDRKELARLLGSVGGQVTFKKYGKKHYKKMLEKRWGKNKENLENSSENSSD